jgi:hypothetical protein
LGAYQTPNLDKAVFNALHMLIVYDLMAWRQLLKFIQVLMNLRKNLKPLAPQCVAARTLIREALLCLHNGRLMVANNFLPKTYRLRPLCNGARRFCTIVAARELAVRPKWKQRSSRHPERPIRLPVVHKAGTTDTGA